MISQTVEYAFRAMSHLASVGDAAATSEEIARSTRVPRGYLSKVMRHLVRARLVRSYRGPRGGFTFAGDPRVVTLLDIVNAVDPIRRIDCCPLDNPLHVTLCPLHRCLDDVLEHMEQTFRHVTVGSVLDGASQAGSCQSLFVPRRPGVPKESL